MDKENIVKYVMDTPANTNPAVLKSMLSSLPEPEGTKTITENGTHDVKDYESAEVNVPGAETLTLTVTNTSSSFKIILVRAIELKDSWIELTSKSVVSTVTDSQNFSVSCGESEKFAHIGKIETLLIFGCQSDELTFSSDELIIVSAKVDANSINFPMSSGFIQAKNIYLVYVRDKDLYKSSVVRTSATLNVAAV